ncbi:response regulator [Rhizobium sp. S152]|uniref:response regulator n=1 Tax=Rhizobium sp. S152 TaxID=3055038 RepID=UPI0025A991F0|nr:response regulator [Rhizobium sp. S152]MDM9629160.1 response regulator [Rhizobium sp. S152]
MAAAIRQRAKGARGKDAGEDSGVRRERRSARGILIMNASSVLVLEDSLIIAMEAEDMLRAFGIETIGIVSSLEQAMEAAKAERYDFALLDVNLGEVMSFDFARHLRALDIPFGFVSGYSDTLDFPPDLQDVPLLVKPFDEAAMRIFLDKLFPAHA